MARFFFCLCLVLTLGMDGSRRSAVIRSGSPQPGFRWGTKESQQLGKQASRLVAGGNYPAAELLHKRQLAIAQANHDDVAVIRSLFSIGSDRFNERRYKDALTPFVQAQRLAQSIGDRLDLGAIDFNLSSLYLQMWDVDAAVSAAQEGMAASVGLETYYRHSALLQAGRLHQMLGDGQGEALLREGIEAAREHGDLAQEALGWDYLGDERFRQEQFADAERAFLESFRIRTFGAKKDLGSSYARLGQLRLTQGDLESASRLTDFALAAADRGQSIYPEYLLLHQRGRIHLARGDVSDAITDFRAAVEQAISWRREVLPASSVLTTSNAELEKRVFDSFVETAAGEAIRTGDLGLRRESFQAMEWNRAQSLREIVGLAEVWRKRLPSRYWQVLSELRQARSEGDRQDLNLKLVEMEAEAGLSAVTNRDENFRTQTSLTSLQKGLSNSDLLLSFHFGSDASYLWALTRRSLNLYALAPARQIQKKIEEFKNDVRAGREAAALSGSSLYDLLFGRLSRDELGKSNWLLSLDDELFEAPLAALRTDGRYLIETHSLRMIPGALWAGEERPLQPSGWFLGVSDPVYNTADSRWISERRSLAPWFAQAATTGGLNRLVASAAEVDSSERSWHSANDTVLTGREAQREKFVALAGHTPAVIHLATHVLTHPLTMPDARGSAQIVFSLEPSGRTGYLSTADVAMLNVPGAIVTMTGCESGGGKTLSGAGLIGLTRAWQVAGAAAVVSTLWPVRDSSGELFTGFYRRLRTSPAAEALRQSQMEMIRSGTWRSRPQYWAAYQVTGGHLGR